MANEVTRPLDQILKAKYDTLSKPEKEIYDAYQVARMRQDQDDTSHVARPQKVEIAHSAQLFKLPGGHAASSIDVVVMGSVITRGYYRDREANSPMYCSSIGGKTGNPTEHGYTLRPEIDRDKTVFCRQCPFDANEFGSDGGGKKCKEMRKLLIFHPSNLKPLLLSIPPTSINAFDRYYDQVDAGGNVVSAMWTTIALETSKKGQQTWSKFSFKAGDALPAEQFMACMKLREAYQESIRVVDAGDYYQPAEEASPSNFEPLPGEVTDDGLPF